MNAATSPTTATTPALRLPDAFSPGATRAAAATPTCSCCCCCCCCVVSTVSATVALPAGFAKDLRRQPPHVEGGGRPTLATLLLGLLPVLMLVLGYFLLQDYEPVPAAALATALTGGTAFVVAALGGSQRPWNSAGRLLLWIAVGFVEFLVCAALLVSGLVVVFGICYVAAVVVAPVLLLRGYRRAS
ncbi:hypothetical protein [Qaidamihabitans albus]|uniref:hypothetical protein n=1 Tax=Qaidamihabitans albus TaxID=2795733 RepID=UPI0018F1555F|nr:hypothetical protein [Qaidamihabitans albus]